MSHRADLLHRTVQLYMIARARRARALALHPRLLQPPVDVVGVLLPSIDFIAQIFQPLPHARSVSCARGMRPQLPPALRKQRRGRVDLDQDAGQDVTTVP